MNAIAAPFLPSDLPNEREARLAGLSSQLLAACVSHGDAARLRVIDCDQEIEVPATATTLDSRVSGGTLDGRGSADRVDLLITTRDTHFSITTRDTHFSRHNKAGDCVVRRIKLMRNQRDQAPLGPKKIAGCACVIGWRSACVDPMTPSEVADTLRFTHPTTSQGAQKCRRLQKNSARCRRSRTTLDSRVSEISYATPD